MAIVTGPQIGEKLLKALGLDSHSVTAIDLRVRVDEVVTVTVTKQVRAEESDELIEVLSHYELHEKQTPDDSMTLEAVTLNPKKLHAMSKANELFQ